MAQLFGPRCGYRLSGDRSDVRCQFGNIWGVTTYKPSAAEFQHVSLLRPSLGGHP
jgi:hypothetical protein